VSIRERRLGDAYEVVIKAMRLRAPQALALRALHDALRTLPAPLKDCTPEQLRLFLAQAGRWKHLAHPLFTFALATGVGKTRLAGAIMAYLFLARESETFLILAPRRAVLRRFSDALSPTFREYIFVDQNLIPEPRIVSADQIDNPVGIEVQQDVFRGGPTIYLLSPQLITSSPRFSTVQEFGGRSAQQHLRSKQDLVVLFDEAHHVGQPGKRETAAWTEAIRALQPRLQIGLTATPRGEEGENVLFSYTLSQALIEREYTKDVHLLVRNFDRSTLSDQDIDRATIDYALRRLMAKESAVRASADSTLSKVKPVCVFFANDIEAAEALAVYLTDTHGLKPESVLVTHSKTSKGEEEVERLLSIENPQNPVRVVVNVQSLTEGWDVTNVYVVAPLRAMATFAGALQAMGRGLRLPAGKRIDDPELDSLDVICFGKESLKKIVDEATRWIGNLATGGGLQVDAHDADHRVAIGIEIPVIHRNASIDGTELEPAHEEVAITISPKALGSLAKMVVDGIDLSRARAATYGLNEVVKLDRERFISATVMRVLQGAGKYLSDDRHYDQVRKIVMDWLAATHSEANEHVEFDPVEVGSEIASLINDGARQRALEYQSTGRPFKLVPEPYQWVVLRSVPDPTRVPKLTLSDIPIASKETFIRGECYRGLDGEGWARSVHAAYSFDSFEELLMAWMLDHSSSIEWWWRNQPRIFRLNTPAGTYSPDFILRSDNGENQLLEIKGAIFWDTPDSDSRLKAASALRWTSAESRVSNRTWTYSVVLDEDLTRFQSWDSMRQYLRRV
jgi:superfamily II DNA or RNA helicase